MSEKKLNPHWREPVEGKDFEPWDSADEWQDIGYACYRKGSDFCLPDGRAYGLFAQGGKKTPYQILRVQWLGYESCRWVFGYCVREKNTKEIVAVIYQGNGWSWWFMFKHQEVPQY